MGKIFKISLLAAAIVVSGVFMQYGALAEEKSEQAAIPSLTNGHLCMVEDGAMSRPQIPVEIDGKTYYGCTTRCVERLKRFKELRTSKDPVTGREIDKADAYKLRQADGRVLYFESKATAEKYASLKGKDSVQR